MIEEFDSTKRYWNYRNQVRGTDLQTMDVISEDENFNPGNVFVMTRDAVKNALLGCK